jgi:hypothetical protein
MCFILLTEVSVALRGSVEFSNVSDVEALYKLGPDLRPETIAKHFPNRMPFVLGFVLGDCQQIPVSVTTPTLV